ncbi:MAG: hypothetical protein AAGH15_15445 [Myxococcota bacterium]
MSEAGADARSPERAPLLAGLAALAAYADFLFSRLTLRLAASGEGALSHASLVRIAQLGDLVRNLAALAGIVAMSLAVVDFLRPGRQLPVSQRVGIASFAGIFLPTTLLAAMLPEARTTPRVVFFALGAAHVMVMLLGGSAFRWPAPRTMRIGLVALTLTAFAALGAGVLQVVEGAVTWAYPVSQALRRTGEVTWLLGLAMLARSAFPTPLPRVRRILVTMVAGLVGALPLLVGTVFRRATSGTAFEDVLYGATHLELLLRRAPTLYLTVLAVLLTAAFAGLFAPTPARRQLALGILSLAAAGYAPTSPSTLLMMALGMMLVTRSYLAAAAIHGSMPLARTEPSLLEVARELEGEPTPDA